MNASRAFTRSIRLALAVACALWAGAAVAQTGAEKESVQAVTERFLRAFENLDWEAFRVIWTSEPTVFFPFADTVERVAGKEAVEARWQKFFRERRSAGGKPPYLRLAPEELRIQQYGDSAIVTFHLRMESRPISRRSLIFVKDKGEWKLAHLHASPNLP